MRGVPGGSGLAAITDLSVYSGRTDTKARLMLNVYRKQRSFAVCI